MEHSITIRDTDVKVTDILDMISKGYSYYQILLTDSRLTLGDIMISAKVAKELIDNFVTPINRISVEASIEVVASGGRIYNLSKMREEHPRAFEKWTSSEEEQLVSLRNSGRDMNEIANVLKRGRGAVKLRLKKLGLTENTE